MQKFAPEIFNYQNLNIYLADVLEFKQKEKSQFSLRAWALKMGFASPSTLSEIISSKRKILPNHMPKILRGLKLSPIEKTYFEMLVYLKNAETLNEQEYYKDELKYLLIKKTHENSFVESLHFSNEEIHFAISLTEKLITHLKKIETGDKRKREYLLDIQLIPKKLC